MVLNGVVECSRKSIPTSFAECQKGTWFSDSRLSICAVGSPQNRIPPIFVNPPDNWCTLISIARQLAPTLISKLTGKFLRITVQSDDEYRKLAQFLRHEGVEYKSFMLKSDRPIKLF
ncbi:hypothetical protein TNCV_2693901 [Trichonephila clavipes]|nr:hypothetical protein TNCV_2693901 [Trichonephila clavipes]